MKNRALGLVVPLLFVLAAACGGGGGEKADRASAAPQTPETTSAVPIGSFPLTGKPAYDPKKLGRRAVAVKIDNDPAARPQAGLDQADVIYEEYTEGITRFIVVFQSSDAPFVGPVRSVRPADPNVIMPLGAPLAFSGGSAGVLDVVRASGIRQITENDTDTLRRRSGRSAPHNLYTSTADLYRKAGVGAPPPALAKFLPPGQPFAAAGATPVTKITLAPAPGVAAAYAWDAASKTWKRSTDGKPHMVEGGGQVAPANVIVEYTPYSTFPADPKVRYPEVIGSGDAVIFADGKMVRGKWTKTAPTSVTTFTDASGAPIVLPPGQTWIHLMERSAALTTG